jgi:hypothetical protein
MAPPVAVRFRLRWLVKTGGLQAPVPLRLGVADAGEKEGPGLSRALEEAPVALRKHAEGGNTDPTA